MHIGVPKEIKNHEYRVGLTPSSVREIVAHGHKVSVETGAGGGIGASDDAYKAAGAEVLSSAGAVFAAADMIVKVKEPQAAERAMLRDGQILFTYLHLAPDPQQCADLIKSNAVCIAYETVTQPGGGLPLLAPMSEVAGRMSIQAGAFCLERAHGGKGVLLGGVAGVPSARIVILGGGVVGSNAAQIAVGTGAQVVVIDRNVDVLRRMDRLLGARVITVYSNQDNIEQHVLDADLVIGGVLVPGAAAPKLVTRKMVEAMRPGSAIVDVAIDQGGCCETALATTHAEPTYKVGEIVHYCVANMPGGVPRTSTFALNNATLPFVLQIADKGWRKALTDDQYLRRGLNVAFGTVTCPEVADALGYTCEDAGVIAAG
ncbi:alanine dehydrogenase [Paraburkholderia oxyphila]|uniref:alanine dehydrogenase n=1 Tax=Paraburkholderia oxyphila TaxID=614212 RepID=UPI000488DC92|nr:alanine dehydrogenase [Paraburkholderia oxyphila]